jgi:hypothetical protein
LQADDDEKRVERMSRWAREALRGDPRKALVSAILRYSAVYGKPPRHVISRANANLLGLRWCSGCQHSERHCECAKGIVA